MSKNRVYIMLISSRGSSPNAPARNAILGDAFITYKAAKEHIYQSLNGKIEITRSQECYIERNGFAWFEVKLTNTEGVSYYFIKIQKTELK